jgi:hypothetical protein
MVKPCLYNLSNAKLNEADLAGAVLTEAILEKTEFVGADFGGADILTFRVDGATFSRAKFKGASIAMPMSKAEFSAADFGGANLESSDLEGANLIEAANLTAAQVRVATGWQSALLPPRLLKDLNLPPDHNSTTLKVVEDSVEKNTNKHSTKPIWWEHRK